MLSTVLGFCTFSFVCLHVFGSYWNVIKGGEAADTEAINGHTLNAATQTLMAMFWLLVTSRLLGW